MAPRLALALVAAAVAACLLLGQSDARFIVETHSLVVTGPTDIKGEYTSALANFGVPAYGGTLAGLVQYAESNPDFCHKSARSDYKTDPGRLPNIVLVDRGNCFFTQKVWYAQLAGASAVLVADDKDESLITMDAPEDDPDTSKYLQNITIPSALVEKSVADKMKKAIAKREMVTVSMDWREALPHPDDRVEYEFWTNSNDECGAKCDVQAEFINNFKGYAISLEQGKFTLFTPHYITWYCPQSYLDSQQCKSQCINNGRYCAPDPEGDFDRGYEGRDVVLENLRELCVFKVGTEVEKPWIWWEYVTDFKKRCRMVDNNYNPACAKTVMESLGIDTNKVLDCMGKPEADEDHPILKQEQVAQVGKGSRGDVTILPTVIINQKQYRGKLDSQAVLKTLCAGFKEGTDPPVCLGSEVQTNECLEGNGGCWTGYNLTACKDTFRGRVCECPRDPRGVNFVGDGYTKCAPAGVGRCMVNNGGCWAEENNGQHFTACVENAAGTGCKCPAGFEGDGFECKDIDECSPDPRDVCNCPECYCTNTYGSYDCACSGGLVYISGSDKCISGSGGPAQSRLWLMIVGIVLGSLVLVAIVSYVVYKYRLRSYMDSEIRAIMAQYMPLDSQNEPLNREGLVKPSEGP